MTDLAAIRERARAVDPDDPQWAGKDVLALLAHIDALTAKVAALPIIDGERHDYDVPGEPTVFTPVWIEALDRAAVLAILRGE